MKKDYPDGPTVEIIELTPDLAREFLGNMATNRHPSLDSVMAIARSIKQGQYYLTGQGLSFDWNDQMIDGQTRCQAVIEANRSITIVVVRGCDPKAQDEIDRVRPRSLAHAFQIHGIINASAAATISKAVWWFLKGKPRGIRGGYQSSGIAKPNHLDQLGIYNKHSESIQESLRESRNVPDVKRTVAALTYFLFSNPQMWPGGSEEDGDTSEDVEDFFGSWITGAGLEQGHPVYVLRESLARDARRPKESRILSNPVVQWAIITKAWNAYREGEEVKGLRYRAGGVAPEPFPMPR